MPARQSPTPLTEADAIRLAQAGDAAAFEFLYALHGRRVYALCLRMVREPSDAEDLMQEAFLQLFRKIGTFRGESAFSTWLHRMTVNVVLMRLRKKTLPATSLDEVTDPDDETGGPRKDVGAPDLKRAARARHQSCEGHFPVPERSDPLTASRSRGWPRPAPPIGLRSGLLRGARIVSM